MKQQKENQLLPGISIIDLGLWIESKKALILADFHLGYEEMLNSQGILMPRANFKDIKERIEQKILPKIKPEIIVLNGDLKHEFGSISQQEWREVIEMIDFLQKHCKKIVLVKGNHDNILGPLALKKGLEIVKEFFLKKEKILICHGDKIPESKEFREAKIVIIGHEHPAISIREGVKREKSKCFLKGKFKGKILIAQPSVSGLFIGTDVLSERLLSQFLQQELGNFEAWAIEDKTYYFGKLRHL